MVIRINVRDELAVQAQMRGVPLERFVEELLAEQVAARSAQAMQPANAGTRNTRTKSERFKGLSESSSDFPPTGDPGFNRSGHPGWRKRPDQR